VVNLLIARFHLRPESISFWRFVIGAVFLLAVFGRPGLGRKAWGHAKLLVTAGTAMALYVLCWFLGIERIGAAIPTLIALCLPPVLVTLVAVARGQEALDAPLALTLGAALAGTVLIVLRHGGAPDDAGVTGLLIGVGFSVASAVLYAGFTLVSGRLSTAIWALARPPPA
jgi:DME family drug/metabolite transporter